MKEGLQIRTTSSNQARLLARRLRKRGFIVHREHCQETMIVETEDQENLKKEITDYQQATGRFHYSIIPAVIPQEEDYIDEELFDLD